MDHEIVQIAQKVHLQNTFIILYTFIIYGGILNGFFKPFPISRINSQGAIDLMHLLFFANIISLNVSSADVRADKKYE